MKGKAIRVTEENQIMLHCLKTVNPFFEQCLKGFKTFEVRKNDRYFQVYDQVLLEEYDPVKKVYSGRKILGVITYVLNDFEAIKKGFVVFSFEIISKIEPSK